MQEAATRTDSHRGETLQTFGGSQSQNGQAHGYQTQSCEEDQRVETQTKVSVA
jgi:hypothetical protein